MDPKQLKQAIAEDIQTIKTLDPEIIPSKIYYRSLAKTFWSVFWKVFLIFFVSLSFIAYRVESWNCFNFMDTNPIHISLLFTTIFMIMVLSPINFFLQFQFHLENKLKTGALIREKIRMIVIIFFSVLSFFCAISGALVYPELVLISCFACIMFSLVTTQIVIGMELSRIGLASLFTLCQEFVGKDNTETNS